MCYLLLVEDNGLVMLVVSQAAREIAEHITSSAASADTLPAGQHSLNNFYCWNYIAPLHADADQTYTVSVSIARTGDAQHYSFCYACWGVILYIKVSLIW